jgi:biopolymer transport protein ExbD
MKHSPQDSTAIDLGFQIAPMIDVVFVIMLFFMVMAGSFKVEQRLSLQLPGIPKPVHVKMPSAEVTVGVREDGSISLNDAVLGDAHDTRLVSFDAAMTRLQQQANSIEDRLLITIQADEQARYQRVIEVLNVLARAHISNITFTVGQDET